MLTRHDTPAGPTLYRSSLLTAAGVPHAVTTRLGGVSAAPCASLNFQPASLDASKLGEPGVPVTPGARSSAPGKDQFQAVVANFQRVAVALNCPRRQVVCVWQVHGIRTCVWPDDVPTRPTESPTVVMQADALATRDPSALLAIRTADCVPSLLASADGKVVAAVHAGWRGVVDGALPAAVGTLVSRFAVEPRRVLAAVGPCIGVGHFEVGPEVAEAFDKAGLGAHIDRTRTKPHIDLAGAIVQQLRDLGVPGEQIDRSDRCTHRDGDEFFSHRRDQGKTGRMAAVIGVACDDEMPMNRQDREDRRNVV